MITKEKLISNDDSFNDEIKIKTEKVDFFEEIICDDSTKVYSAREENVNLENPRRTEEGSLLVKKHFRKNVNLRGLLPPETDNSYLNVLNIPTVKRCCVEHCYFSRKRSRYTKYNLRRSPANNAATLQFGNESLNEQQTVDFEQEDNSVFLTSSVDENKVNYKNKKKCSNRLRNYSSVSSIESDIDSVADDSNDRDYYPDENSTDSENASGESCNSIKQIWKSRSRLKNVESVGKKLSSRNPAPNISDDFVSVHDLFKQIKNMQKLMKSTCDKKYMKDSRKTGKIPLPRLKKITGQGKCEEFPKFPKYSFPVNDLTKTANGEKNWRVEYTDNEVQNLGLDDLLLKASELNAENFTKALGRKLEPSKPNLNPKDSSEIVFTIPKSKKPSTDEEQIRQSKENDFSKHSKTFKLDISKPFFEPEKTKEAEASQEVLKPPDAISSKRPGIKVKTVENINEEFKDSLELKNKTFQDCNLNGVDKEIVSGIESRSSFVSQTIEKKDREQEESEKNSGEGTPFIMTIIQNKAEKQRPAILRNSSYFKKKSEKLKSIERTAEPKTDINVQCEKKVLVPESKKEDWDFHTERPQALEEENRNNSNQVNSYVKKMGSYSKISEESENETPKTVENANENKLSVKKRNFPFILSSNKKSKQMDLPPLMSTTAKSPLPAPNKLVKTNEENDKTQSNEKSFTVTSVEQKLGPKEINKRFIKVVPYEPMNKKKGELTKDGDSPKVSDEEFDKNASKDLKNSPLLSLTAFSNILRQILPDKWYLCLDKKYGLQIIKTQVDESLNPSILISVVIGRCGKVTVNVRGKQLKKSHELFSNLCNMKNSENKLSLNYVLAILNKLRCLSVCFGCDDSSLKKYWCGNGIVEYQTEFQQVYRSQLCQLLVSFGKKRCYPCYRMNESIKKRYRKDKLEQKAREDDDSNKSSRVKEVSEDTEDREESPKTRGFKRNLEDFLEESFSTMKQQITDEIEKNKKLGERENALKAQEEVLSFMGLARKGSLDNTVRKSKRKKNSFFKLQQPVKKKIDQQELEFLEKYWTDINTLFSTSLLFGAYSRTGRGRLREKCRMFQKLLSTWKNIVRNNPEWIGGEISLPHEVSDGETVGKNSSADQFEKMDVPALRAYIINSVKEVNRIKHKLRTRNSYFKILYNKFVKRRMKRPNSLKEKKRNGSSGNTPTPTDFSSDDSSRDKEKNTDDENRPVSDLIMTCVSDGD